MRCGNLTASICRQKHTGLHIHYQLSSYVWRLHVNTKPWDRNVLDGYNSLQFISECSKRCSSYTKRFYCFCTIKWPLCFISTRDQCKDTTFVVDQFCTRFTSKDSCDFFLHDSFACTDDSLWEIHVSLMMNSCNRLHFKVKHSKTLTCCPHYVLSFHTVLAINSHYFLKQH